MLDLSEAPLGEQLRRWRQARRMSQMDLALDAEISARHLSFVETGRSRPSREMVLRLAERLDIPLRQRNALLLAAGFAPFYGSRPLDDPDLREARAAVDKILEGHEPFPALAIDRHWTMLGHNKAVPKLLGGVSPELLDPPVNVLRLSLHPEGLAPRIVNLGDWKRHLIDRLRNQVAASADPVLAELIEELRSYPAEAPQAPFEGSKPVFLPLMLRTEGGTLSLFSTTTMFGTPIDIICRKSPWKPSSRPIQRRRRRFGDCEERGRTRDRNRALCPPPGVDLWTGISIHEPCQVDAAAEKRGLRWLTAVPVQGRL